MRSILPDIGRVRENRHRREVICIDRVWSGTAGVHARAETTGRPLFVKTLPQRGGHHSYELFNMTVQREWSAAAIPTITPVPTPAGVLHRQPGLAMSVWDRIAFDPGTAATSVRWQDIGIPVTAAYLGAGGPLAPAEIVSSARLALLHRLTTAYPLSDLITGQLPARVYDQQRIYWNQRCITIDRMLDLLPDLEQRPRELTSPEPAGCSRASIVAASGQQANR
ncbi:hypothetical protein AB0M47_27480 [Hamadaea sp. NPDC051192]|uniref:hypothetical protein n=1 Tax=Hamadaea sp. NPDC051192 TaxID=3154940 RepID=UPI0034431F30